MIIIVTCVGVGLLGLLVAKLALRGPPPKPRRYMMSGRARDAQPERVYQLRLSRNSKARHAAKLMQRWREDPKSEGREPTKADVIPILRVRR